MLSYPENILYKLTGKSSLSDVSAEDLQQIADQHPYFGAAQFLLAKKLFSENNGSFKDAVQKAALHFPNPLWLHFNFTQEATDIDEATSHRPVIQEKQQISADKEEDEGEMVEQYAEVDDTVNEKISSLLKEQADEFEKPVEEATLPLENTPYHRVDYFDSQGIKLEEKEADDKLGTQLRRFTDWLKQMKRISSNPADLGTDQIAESQVQNLAEHSNERREIVTETMAEVLIKQGKPDQAIHIYEKLSFLNPSKSTYFAAKIAELKA
jgi:tetratricopeptide (TPR) repeat protein